MDDDSLLRMSERILEGSTIAELFENFEEL
jgi:hypothetical protein